MAAPIHMPSLGEKTIPNKQSKNKMWLARFKKWMYHWFFAAIAGVSLLGFVRVLAPFLGYTIKLNVASISIAALLGVPGVVLILWLRVCFGCG